MTITHVGNQGAKKKRPMSSTYFGPRMLHRASCNKHKNITYESHVILKSSQLDLTLSQIHYPLSWLRVHLLLDDQFQRCLALSIVSRDLRWCWPAVGSWYLYIYILYTVPLSLRVYSIQIHNCNTYLYIYTCIIQEEGLPGTTKEVVGHLALSDILQSLLLNIFADMWRHTKTWSPKLALGANAGTLVYSHSAGRSAFGRRWTFPALAHVGGSSDLSTSTMPSWLRRVCERIFEVPTGNRFHLGPRGRDVSHCRLTRLTPWVCPIISTKRYLPWTNWPSKRMQYTLFHIL